MIIRAYEPKDEAKLLKVFEDATRGSHPFLSDRFIAAELEAIVDQYLPKMQTWVADEDGFVGFASVLPSGEVAGLFVDPAYQRRGIGTALLRHVHTSFAEIFVEVFEANVTARRFYAALGFQRVSQRRHEETGERLLFLKRIETSPTIDTSDP